MDFFVFIFSWVVMLDFSLNLCKLTNFSLLFLFFFIADDSINITIDMINKEFSATESPANTVNPLFDGTPGVARGSPVFDDTPLPVRSAVVAGIFLIVLCVYCYAFYLL